MELNAEWNGDSSPQSSVPERAAVYVAKNYPLGLDIPDEDPERTAFTSQFLNINKLCAHLIDTRHPSFSHLVDLFALWTLRNALEEPDIQKPSEFPDVFIPAASIWIATAGAHLYRWEYNFPFGGRRGDPGRTGDLWRSRVRHGFCRERWEFWKWRLEELAVDEYLEVGLRLTAGEAAERMGAIERQAG